MPTGSKECVGHTAADGEGVDLCHEVFQEVDLGRDFRAADHGQHRFDRCAERLVEGVEFTLHGAPGIGGEQFRENGRRDVAAVGGRKRIVDIDVAECGDLFCERHVALFLARIKAGVFQQDHTSRGKIGNRSLDVITLAVSHEGHIRAENLCERACNRRETHLRNPLSLWAAKVREQDNLGTLGAQGLDCLDG